MLEAGWGSSTVCPIQGKNTLKQIIANVSGWRLDGT